MADHDASTPPAPPRSANPVPPAPTDARTAILCPYCGRTQWGGERCGNCGGLFEPLSRMATQIAMGPWYIRDKANPFNPGCSYETLQQMIRRGRIHPNTVLRGPTTHQFWSVARNVPGVAHLIGFCHRCNARVPTDAQYCPECSERFSEPRDRNQLGLAFPSEASVKWARQELQRRLERDAGVSPQTAADAPATDAHAGNEEVGLLGESMAEAMEHLATADQADATGYGMTLSLPEDDTPVVASELGDTSRDRAAAILGRRGAEESRPSDPSPTPEPPREVPSPAHAPAPALATPEPAPPDAPSGSMVGWFIAVVLVILGILAVGVLFTDWPQAAP